MTKTDLLKDLSQSIGEPLSRVSRRIFIVWLVNGARRKHLYFFGPKKRLEDMNKAFGDEKPANFHIVPHNDAESAGNYLKPMVMESIQQTSGQPAILVAVPSAEDLKRKGEATIHNVNVYLFLYDGTNLRLLDQNKPVGRELLQKMETDADAYLELIREFPVYKAAFNRFLYQEAMGSQIHKQIPSKGEEFHPNFDEIFFDYLLREDEKAAFDYRWLDWPEWNKYGLWPEQEKKQFARLITIFKGLLLEKHPNRLDDNDLQKGFQEKRRAVLNLSKTAASHLMLSQLPYWILHELYGKHTRDVDPSDTENLIRAIKAKNESKRKVMIHGSGKEITLAMPKGQLTEEKRKELERFLRERVGDLVEAWGKKDEKKRRQFLDEIINPAKGQALEGQALVALEKGLKVVENICDGNTGKAKTLRSSVVSILNGLFIPILTGKPVTLIQQVEAGYVYALCDLYMQSELLRDKSANVIREEALKGRETISDRTDETGELAEKQETYNCLLRSFLVSTLGALNDNIVEQWQALERWAWLRINILKKGVNTLVDGEEEPHSRKGEKGMGAATKTPDKEFVLKTIASRENAAHLEREAAANAGSDEGQEEEEERPPLTEAREETGKEEKPSEDAEPEADSSPPAGETDQADTLREFLMDYEPANLGSDKGNAEATLDAKAESFVEAGREAYKFIFETREKSDTPMDFKRLCRKVALSEIFFIKHEKLQFGKDLSCLYQMALDLLSIGSTNPERFLEIFSVTDYFLLEDGEDLFDLFRRFELVTEEAAESMARFISEWRAFECLLEKVGDRLDRNNELVVFNGTATDFIEWVEECRHDHKEYLDPALIGSPMSILPNAVCMTDSALLGNGSDGRVTREFFQRLREFPIHADQNGGFPRPCVLPPIIGGTVKPFDEEFGWLEPFKSQSEYGRDDTGFPCPLFYLGPAKGVGRRITKAKISCPVSFYVLEHIIRGHCSEDEIVSTKQDPRNKKLDEWAFSFTEGTETISGAASRFVKVGRPDTLYGLPFEAAMWIHVLSVLYVYLDNVPKLSPFVESVQDKEFWEWFRIRENMSRHQLADTQKERGHLREPLNILGAETSRFSLDRENEILQVWNPIEETVEATYLIPWINRLFKKNSEI